MVDVSQKSQYLRSRQRILARNGGLKIFFVSFQFKEPISPEAEPPKNFWRFSSFQKAEFPETNRSPNPIIRQRRASEAQLAEHTASRSVG